MQCILTPDISPAIQELQTRLRHELSKTQRVLWLVSGGSNITAAVSIMESIKPEAQSRLTVMLCDERYGIIGHPDSNLQQLQAAGFKPGAARLVSVLQTDLTLEETGAQFAETVERELANADVIIAQLGIGPDGHIAGILPGSAAADDTDAFAISYISNPYQRITMSLKALRAITADYTFAYGSAKRQALEQLQATDTSVYEQPSQILKQLPEAYVFNDQIGDQI